MIYHVLVTKQPLLAVNTEKHWFNMDSMTICNVGTEHNNDIIFTVWKEVLKYQENWGNVLLQSSIFKF